MALRRLRERDESARRRPSPGGSGRAVEAGFRDQIALLEFQLALKKALLTAGWARTLLDNICAALGFLGFVPVRSSYTGWPIATHRQRAQSHAAFRIFEQFGNAGAGPATFRRHDRRSERNSPSQRGRFAGIDRRA